MDTIILNVGDDMTVWRAQTNSVEETIELAAALGSMLKPGDVVTLDGDLGAGKTHFAKGIAVALGVNGVVNSPTFTIIKEYEGNMPFYHMDLYRAEGQVQDLGLEEYFYGDGVTVVEWASLLEEALPNNRFACSIHLLGETKRELILKPVGEENRTRLEGLRQWQKF